MTLPTGHRTGTDRKRRDGFTLIELILVMAILIIVLSMSGPSLRSFFQGRSLEAEGKRFLALTRHAQNRAVSEGLPMSLWVNARQGKYGLEIAPGFVEEDKKASEFQLGRDLEIEISDALSGPVQQVGGEISIRFTPDGFMSETNPEEIVIKEKNGESVVITPSRSRLNYEINTNQISVTRR